MVFTQLDTARAGYDAWRHAQMLRQPPWAKLTPTQQYAWLQATTVILQAYATWLASLR